MSYRNISQLARRKREAKKAGPQPQQSSQRVYVSRPIPTYQRSIKVSPKKFALNIAASSTVVTKGSITFQLTDMVDYLSMGNVFDMYCIHKAKVFFVPQTQPMINAVSGVGYATMVSSIDYDDANLESFSNLNDLLSYDNSIIHQTYTPTVRTLKPKVSKGVLQSITVVPAEVAKGSTWLDCSYATIQHFGVKYIIAQCTATAVPSWDIYVQTYIEFKSRH
jgi:hypothetical protein